MPDNRLSEDNLQSNLPSTLQSEIEQLRQVLAQEQQERADLEILLENTIEHADAIDLELRQTNQQLQAELAERKRIEVELKASQVNLRHVLSVINREKADLEILADILTEHGDVTSVQLQHEAQKTAQEGQRRLSQFLEAVPVGIFVVDAKGSPYYANQMAQVILGHSTLPDALPEQLPEIYRMFLTGTNDLYPHDQQPIVRALNGESSHVSDAEIRRDEQVIPLEIWATPIFDEVGKVAYAIAAFQDIGERKQAEADREQFIDDLFRLNVAGERFVPRQFLNLLGYESIAEVNPGDQVQKEMSVLFSDIRDFTALSEELSPAESFQFINSYVSCMEPVIEKNHGFVDKYIGDAIMALFGGPADDALRAGIGMLQQLQNYNEHRWAAGQMPIEIGIGINTGPLILGIVGGNHRVQGTVISDTVNLAARVEDMTKDYRVSLLVTEQTVEHLQKPEDYCLRKIAQVKVRGRTGRVTLYEAFDADPPELQYKKLETTERFQTALEHYHRQQFVPAREGFDSCVAQNPLDAIARAYLTQCQDALNKQS